MMIILFTDVGWTWSKKFESKRRDTRRSGRESTINRFENDLIFATFFGAFGSHNRSKIHHESSGGPPCPTSAADLEKGRCASQCLGVLGAPFRLPEGSQIDKKSIQKSMKNHGISETTFSTLHGSFGDTNERHNAQRARSRVVLAPILMPGGPKMPLKRRPGSTKKHVFFESGDFLIFHIKHTDFLMISLSESITFWYQNRCQIDEKLMMLMICTPGTSFWPFFGGEKAKIYSLGSIFGAPGREERKNGSIMVPRRGPKSDQKSMQNEVVSRRRKSRLRTPKKCDFEPLGPSKSLKKHRKTNVFVKTTFFPPSDHLDRKNIKKSSKIAPKWQPKCSKNH